MIAEGQARPLGIIVTICISPERTGPLAAGTGFLQRASHSPAANAPRNRILRGGMERLCPEKCYVSLEGFMGSIEGHPPAEPGQPSTSGTVA